MNLNRVLQDISDLLIEPATPTNGINFSGDVEQSKYKLAIESGNTSSEDTYCEVNVIVGVSCDSHEELLFEIGKVIFLLRRKQIRDTGNRGRIELDSNNGFQIFTPESGKWISNLRFTIPVIYDFTEYMDKTDDNSIYSNKNKTEQVQYIY